LQIANIKLKIEKWMVFPKILHFAFCNFHFSMRFSVSFQSAKLIRISESSFFFTNGFPRR